MTRPVRRSPVSPRRYLVRRVVVGVCLGLLVIGFARVIAGLGGNDDGRVQSADDPSEVPAGADSDGPGPDGATSDGATTDGAPSDGATFDGATSDGATSDPGASDPSGGSDGDAGSTPVAGEGAAAGERTPSGPPTPADPARVLIVGDSDAGTFGPYLQELLGDTRVTDTRLDYKVSSGLARPDFFDWHAELEVKVAEFDPDIVVVTFGGNDGQFLADENGGVVVGQARPDSDNSEWTAEYRARVGRVLDDLAAVDRTVVWVGIPNHVDPDVRFRMQLQDQAVKAEVAERPDVEFVDAWNRFAGRNGNFAEFVIDPRDGQGKAVRASDGFHLNQVGAEILAIDISQVIFADLRARGAAI